MNEEIKFRVWDIDNKKLYKDIQLQYSVGKWIALPYGVNEKILVDNFFLIQNTGIQDNIGKEIYYEDIVEFSFHDKDEPKFDWSGTAVITKTISRGVGLLVEYPDNNRKNPLVFAPKEGGQIEEFWEDQDLWTVKIIGNTFEHPNLLKGGEYL